ncbi:MAG: GNAT family N-acetyltransferase [Parvularculaceae bacterium]|nr:GNAT family N-acetyltransferase [Parvularculaceae bacterium]
MPMRQIEIAEPKTAGEIDAVKALFIEYAQFLDVDLCFQGFDKEIATFPAAYRHLLLAFVDGEAAGAVGLKDLGRGVCEMKRLYVRPGFQGLGLGRRLSLAVIDAARAQGFTIMRLDTLHRLKPAIALYTSLGFAETDSYYDNPLDGVIYMALGL